jgi:excisionase family DNA binding protein
VLIVADDRLTAHVAAAVAEHVRLLRRDGLPVPTELLRLAAIRDCGGQRRPTLDGSGSGVDSAGVQPLTVDYRRAAEVLDVSERSVRRAVSRGELPAVEVAGCRRIRTADLAEFVAQLQPIPAKSETEERHHHG